MEAGVRRNGKDDPQVREQTATLEHPCTGSAAYEWWVRTENWRPQGQGAGLSSASRPNQSAAAATWGICWCVESACRAQSCFFFFFHNYLLSG